MKLAPSALPTLFKDVHKSSPAHGQTLVRAAIGGKTQADFENGQELVRWSSYAKPEERRAVIAGFRAEKLGIQYVHGAALLSSPQRARLIADWFEAGGDLKTVMEWVRMAVADPSTRKRSSGAQTRGKRGLFDAIGDALGAIGDAISGLVGGLVDAVIKAGKSIASAVAETLSWAVGEIASLCKALIAKGKKAAEFLASAAQKSLTLLGKYVQALIDIGQTVATVLVWAATQISNTVRKVVGVLLDKGIALAKIVGDAVAKGLQVVTATAKALLSLGKQLAVVLGPIAALAAGPAKLLVSALLSLGKLAKDQLIAAAQAGVAIVNKVVSSLLSLGKTALEIVGAIALQAITVVKSTVGALLAAGQKLGTLIASGVNAAGQIGKRILEAALSLGHTVASILLSVAQNAASAIAKTVKALLAQGRALGEIFAGVAKLAVSVVRTTIEAVIASGVTLVKIIGATLENVVTSFQKGFFEGLIALGKSPFVILRAAVEIGVAQAALAFALLLEILGGHRPLSVAERAEAVKVFGSSIDLDRVKIANASLAADLITYVNGDRPFTTMYVLNFPSSDKGRTDKEFVGTVIHELAHVWQGVQVGPLYMIEALEAQYQSGEQAYAYTEAELIAANGDFDAFNREQQAQIVQDYWTRKFSSSPAQDTTSWQPYADRVFKPVKSGGGSTTPTPSKGGTKDPLPPLPKPPKGQPTGPKLDPKLGTKSPKGLETLDPNGSKNPPPVKPSPKKPGTVNDDLIAIKAKSTTKKGKVGAGVG